MSIEAMKLAHDLSLDGKHFEARQLLLEAIEEAEKQEKTVPLSEYLELQKLVTSQGIRLMEYESKQEPVSIQITDEMVFAFHRALGDGALGKEELEEIKTGLSSAIVNLNLPKREWVGLTYEWKKSMAHEAFLVGLSKDQFMAGVDAAESKLKELNT
jgi:hypothetical protein